MHNQWKCELLSVIDCVLPFSSAAAYEQDTHYTEGTGGLRAELTKPRKDISNVWQISLQHFCGVGKISGFILPLPLNHFSLFIPDKYLTVSLCFLFSVEIPSM